MSIWQKIKNGLRNLMIGRHGADHFGMFTLTSGLILSLLGMWIGFPVFSWFGLILYGYTVFRMFSRNHDKRNQENQKYIRISSGIKTSIVQFSRRLKNRKDYKYFKCPNCKVLLRLRRGCGEKEITCVRCGHHFSQKA